MNRPPSAPPLACPVVTGMSDKVMAMRSTFSPLWPYAMPPGHASAPAPTAIILSSVRRCKVPSITLVKSEDAGSGEATAIDLLSGNEAMVVLLY